MGKTHILHFKRIKRDSAIIILCGVLLLSCYDKRQPGRVYMPDMAYSRSYQAYDLNTLKQKGINYINYPVDGTIRRGDLFPYTVPNDSNGYKMSVAVKDPLPPLDSISLKEAQRLFNINCAICHGPNMDAQGPLAGKVGAIANLKLPQYIKLPEGQMFHSVTYGKNNMGSYASQLDKRQRWMVIQYIKSVQAGAATTATPVDSTSIKATGDSTSAKAPAGTKTNDSSATKK